MINSNSDDYKNVGGNDNFPIIIILNHTTTNYIHIAHVQNLTVIQLNEVSKNMEQKEIDSFQTCEIPTKIVHAFSIETSIWMRIADSNPNFECSM